MEKVTVKKQQLVEILKKNRLEHHDIVVEAQKKYREVAIQQLDRQLSLARSGQDFFLAEIVKLVMPKDYTKEYDRAIRMLEMSVDDNISITNEEFANFVEDDWNWTHSWAMSNMHYTNSDKVKSKLGI